MQERVLELAGGSLLYQAQEKGICILRWQGSPAGGTLAGGRGELCVPAQIEGMPVVSIGKKAFLSQKQLRKVILPDSIAEVGDWAFAYCGGLKEVELPRREIAFEKSVFLECEALEFLWIRESKVSSDSGLVCAEVTEVSDSALECVKTCMENRGNGKMTAALLAAAVKMGEGYYLLDACGAGSREWLAKWDARVMAIIHASDGEGFSGQEPCGEEDYGSTDFGAYVSNRRKAKVRLMLLRLLHSLGLAEDTRKELQNYLKSHTKGCDSEETWEVVLKEHGEDREYYGLFAELGCVTGENLDEILGDIGEGYPEMKAYFIRYHDEHIRRGDFFEGLEL